MTQRGVGAGRGRAGVARGLCRDAAAMALAVLAGCRRLPPVDGERCAGGGAGGVDVAVKRVAGFSRWAWRRRWRRRWRWGRRFGFRMSSSERRASGTST